MRYTRAVWGYVIGFGICLTVLAVLVYVAHGGKVRRWLRRW